MPEVRIAVVIDRSSSYGREVILGILQVAQRLGWRIDLLSATHPHLVRALQRVHPDGVVVLAHVPAQTAACLRLGVPVVNVGHLQSGSGLLHVGNDDHAIGAMAAEHLLKRGLHTVAAIGVTRQRMDRLRIAGFRETVLAAGCTCQVFEAATFVDRLPAWMARQAQPVGIFAVHDGLGSEAIAALQHAGIAVPERAAVLGVDNDDILCRLSRPELSSVAVARREIGNAAAELLAARLAGKPVAATRFIPPLKVVVRASSDQWAVSDPELVTACAFIRAHAHRHIGPEQVVAAVPLSRSTLQRRFRQAFGQTLRTAILETRLDRARTLLVDTELKLAAIARAAGFTDAAQLIHAFRRAERTTPDLWRRRVRDR